MTDRLLEAYEAAPYTSKPIRYSHVSSLELVGRLYGMTPSPSDACRVLELGCASGGNIIPMAASLPRSRFVGIDLAPSQIARGVETVTALGLENIELHAMSIADVTRGFGEFDYIICHGVYSWVPPGVQNAILRVASENLAPTGIAYISYNSYPGWRLRGIGRDLLLYGDDPSRPPLERATRARHLMEIITKAERNPNSVYAAVIEQEFAILRDHDDVLLLHEQLEPYNEPLYFTEFMRRAQSYALRYVGEATLGANLLETPSWMCDAAGTEPDAIQEQQLMDFSRGSAFRRTLLTHDGVASARFITPSALRGMHFVMRAVSVQPEGSAGNTGAEAFREPDGAVMTTSNLVALTVFRALLHAGPMGLSFAEIERRVQDRLVLDRPPGIPATETVSGLDDLLLRTARQGFLEILNRPLATAASPSERPVAPRFIRQGAIEGKTVTSLRHYPVAVSGLERVILMNLDGSKTRDDLVTIVERAIAGGDLSTSDEQPDRAELVDAVEAALQRMCGASLLEA